MGIFSFFTKNRTDNNSSEYTIKYNVENWVPNQNSYLYDRFLSLENYLIQENIPKFERIEIMGTKDPFDTFNIRIMNLDGSDMRYAFEKQIENFKSRTILWAIRECDIYGTSENVCMYLLYKIGQIFRWNMFESAAMSKEGQKKLLDMCAHDNYREIVLTFDPFVFTAFAFVHRSSGVNLSDAIKYGLDFLANNSKHTNSGHGNLYNVFGKANIEAIIYKVFEANYKLDEFEFNNLFYPQETTKLDCDHKEGEIIFPFDVKTLRYCGKQIVNKKEETFYYLKPEHKSQCETYIEILKEVYNQSKEIISSIKVPSYKNNKLSFVQGHVDGVITSSLFFAHKFTNTQKISKFPSSISIRFENNDKSNNNRMYFDKNGSVKRVETYYEHFSIIAIMENTNIKVTNIYKHNDYGVKKKVYPL